MNEHEHEPTRLRPDGLPDAATDMSGMLDLEVPPGGKLDEAQKDKIRERVLRNIQSAAPETQRQVNEKLEEFLAGIGSKTAEQLCGLSVAEALNAMVRKLTTLGGSVLTIARGLCDVNDDERFSPKQVFDLGEVRGCIIAAAAILNAARSDLQHALDCDCYRGGEHIEDPSERPTDPPAAPAEEAS